MSACETRRSASSDNAPRVALRFALLAAVALATIGVGTAGAETMSGALVKAYLTNPDINTQRATVRQTDESVPTANAGYLPTIQAVGSIGAEHTNGNQIIPGQAPINYNVGPFPRSVGIQAQENVFDGYRTINGIRGAELQVLAARETLRNTEQTTLLSGVQAYMDVLQNSAIVDLDRNNVDVLKEQLRETRDRFTVGEVTRTDVAQAEASLASANAQLLSDQAVLEASVATYRQVIGDEPKTLAPVKPLTEAVAENPAGSGQHFAGRASGDRRPGARRRRGDAQHQDRGRRALPPGQRAGKPHGCLGRQQHARHAAVRRSRSRGI